jgi:hypothetical protein
VLRQNLAAPRVYLDLPLALQAGSFETKVKPTDPTEE